MSWKSLAAAFVLATGSLGPVPSALGTTETAPLANLDFEQGEVGQEPPGWFVPGTVKEKGYAATT